MKKHKQIKIIILLIAISINASTYMGGQCEGNNTFNGTTDNDWSKTTNWSEGCVPGVGTITGTISIIADCEVNDALNYTFGSGATLEIADGITFTNNGTGIWTIDGVSGNGTYVGNITINGDLKPGYTSPPSWSCGDALIYEGQSYATIQIGGQCWMAENLNVGTMINSTINMSNNAIIEKYCYINDPDNCDIYGALYQWDEMMQYVNTESTKGICPTGWHLPSDGEYIILEEFLGMVSGTGSGQSGATGHRGTNEGSKLAGNEPLWYDEALDQNAAFGLSGLDVLPGGIRDFVGQFFFQTTNAYIWTSSYNLSGGIRRSINYNVTTIYRGTYFKETGFSVRCIQN